MRGKFWRLRIRVASGIIALVPLVVTFVVVRWVLLFTSGILLPVLDPAVTEWPWILQAALSLLTLLVGLYLLGELAAHVVGKRMLGLGENLVLKVPMVKGVYAAAKQIVAAFQGPGSKAFKSVVFVPFPHPGTRAVGFVTSSISATDGEVWNTVFVPTTPNPTSGFLQLMPEKDVVTTDLTVEEGVKMVMSLGALVPERTARFF
ncbi:MAG: DUF502 domain-containing protein [Gemmatimonadetes bacterium]|nr:DUF502 domain-containing protein [Gemmatimonadota bacterium]